MRKKMSKTGNSLNTVYFREQARYTFAEMERRFSGDAEKMLTVLLKSGVVKQVKRTDEEKDLSELAEEDFALGPVEGGDEKLYTFCFVGVLLVNGYVLKCLPKYYTSIEGEENRKKAETHLKTVFNVLKKFNRTADREQIYLYNDNAEGRSFNFLAVGLYLLQDYHENGLYTNEKAVVETNGSGEILWDRTINNTFAILQNGAPFYMELQTRRRVSDENDYFRRLHQSVLSLCSERLIAENILDLFELAPADVIGEELDNFGETEYICYRIEQELNVQFNTRKKLLLKTIYAFIKNERSLQTEDYFSMFGTNAFHVVWEAVCKKVLCDKLSKKIKTVELFQATEEVKNKSFQEFIEKPSWNGTEEEDTATRKATFIPDVVSVEKLSEDSWHFAIFDAKYYRVGFNAKNEISGQPGIESVSKQFLYEMAYRPLLRSVSKVTVTNSFIFPYEQKENIVKSGTVTMPMFTSSLSGTVDRHYGFGLQPIGIVLVRPQYFYENYLNEKNVLTDMFRIV